MENLTLNQLEKEVEIVYDVYHKQQKDWFPFIWKKDKLQCQDFPFNQSSLEEIIKYFKKTFTGHSKLQDIIVTNDGIIYLINSYNPNDYSTTWMKYKVVPKIKLKGGQK